MKRKPHLFSIVTMLACSALLAGCGPGYPNYTLDGSPESRVVVIHLDENTTERVPCGTGMGAGLTSEHKMALSAGEDAVVEKGDAKVTMAGKGQGVIFVVKKVEYQGKEVLFHEPIL